MGKKIFNEKIVKYEFQSLTKICINYLISTVKIYLNINRVNEILSTHIDIYTYHTRVLIKKVLLFNICNHITRVYYLEIKLS